MYTYVHGFTPSYAKSSAPKVHCVLYFIFKSFFVIGFLPGARKDYCVFIDLIGLSNWRIYK